MSEKFDFSTDETMARLQKREALLKLYKDAYPAKTGRTHEIGKVLQDYKKLEKKKSNLVIAGRVRSIRIHGGSAFVNIDDGDIIQLFFSKKDVGDKQYNRFTHLIDIGDFIEAHGHAYTTKKGEQSLFATDWKPLVKTLLPLPEKWHGLSDVETRFRKRYLDLIMNEEVRGRLVTRSLIISAMRSFLDKKGFLEVETPTLQPMYGGGFARPFVTHHNSLDADFYLRISDEMYLKRLLVGGMQKVYEITKVFRNEGIDRDHNPEFTMFEAQIAYQDYEYGMDLFEEIFESVVKDVLGATKVDQNGVVLDFKRPFKRIKLVDSLKKVGGLDHKVWNSVKVAKASCKSKLEKSVVKDLDKMDTVGEIMAFAFEELVEKKLIQPTIIYDYPVEVSPLAKKCKDERFTQRFEVFARGMEIGNNYSELNDPKDLEERFIGEKKKEKAGFEEAHQTDYDYLEAIKHGFPPACGIGIGIDRMVMILTGAKNIKEVIAFPTLKPKKHD